MVAVEEEEEEVVVVAVDDEEEEPLTLTLQVRSPSHRSLAASRDRVARNERGSFLPCHGEGGVGRRSEIIQQCNRIGR